MLVDAHVFLLIHRRAQYPVYLKYGINKAELAFLVELSGYLRHLERKIVSKKKLFETITANSREKRKMEGYLLGCVNGGFIALYEYKPKPGSMSLGITELGLNAIKLFEKEVSKLMEVYKPSPVNVLESNYVSKHTPIAA